MLPSGEEKFREVEPKAAGLIDSATEIPQDSKSAFWDCVNQWEATKEIHDHVDECCREFSFVGPEVPLGQHERLGTAQRPQSIANAVFTTEDEDLDWVRPTKEEVKIWISIVTEIADEVNALEFFRRKLGPARIGTGRVFAFRNPSEPECPVDIDDLRVQFNRLAIPNGEPRPIRDVSFPTRCG